MMMFQTLMTIGCLLGNYLNCKKKKICFIIWAVCNVGWFFVDLNNGAYSRMMLNVVQIGFNLYGLKQWTKNKGGKEYEDE